jgi:hypothetical protein
VVGESGGVRSESRMTNELKLVTAPPPGSRASHASLATRPIWRAAGTISLETRCDGQGGRRGCSNLCGAGRLGGGSKILIDRRSRPKDNSFCPRSRQLCIFVGERGETFDDLCLCPSSHRSRAGYGPESSFASGNA